MFLQVDFILQYNQDDQRICRSMKDKIIIFVRRTDYNFHVKPQIL